MDAYIAIAEQIKKEVSRVLHVALSGVEKKYRTEDKYIRWGLVEKDIHKIINYNLLSDD